MLTSRSIAAALSLIAASSAVAAVLPGPTFSGINGVAPIDLNGDGIIDCTLGNVANLYGYGTAPEPNGFRFDPIYGAMLPGGSTFGPDSEPFGFWGSLDVWHIECVGGPDGCVSVCDACGSYYLGLRFAAADGFHYGWMRVDINQISNGNYSFAILESAWESVANTAIVAGFLDCNANGISDEVEILIDPALDCDRDGLLDQCEPDALPSLGEHALAFDGESGRVSVLNFGAAIPTSEVTVEFWIRVDEILPSVAFAAITGDDLNRFSAHVPWSDGTVYFDFGNFLAGGRIAYQPPVPIVGSWQHFAFVASASQNAMRIYRNGVLEASKPGMTPFVSGDFELSLGGIPGFVQSGALDDVRIWNHARSEAQILDGMHGVNEQSFGLLASWRCEEGTGTATVDGASGFYGTLTGGVSWLNAPACIQPTDLNADGAVDGADLAILLGAWGPCPKSSSCPTDFTGDGTIDAADLAILLGAFGS